MEVRYIMKKILILLSSILLVIVLLISVISYLIISKPYTEIIQLNWDIKLPKPCKEIYAVDSGASFHGDGERYHIFEYKNEDDINLSLNWENSKNIEIELAIKKVLNNLNVSRENMPNFEDNYKYYSKTKKDSSKIYFVFFPNIKKLYVIEDIC
jgi:hypothetical protein